MTVNKGWLEKREFERVKSVLKVIYYIIDDKNKENIVQSSEYKDTTLNNLKTTSKNPIINALTEDISKGGLAIITEKPLVIGQHIIIDLYLPKLSKPIKLLTEVRNIDSYVKGSGSYKAGLRILSISKSDLQRIENHILEIKKKGE